MADTTQETFTIALAWGQEDEGLYHWAGQAPDLDAAIKAAREEMDRTYNEEYATDDADMRRGIAADEPTTEYATVDIIVGVNEYAALDMLKALRLGVAALEKFMPWDSADEREAHDAMVKAIASGEGR